MSIFSQAWKNIGGAVQAVAKPFISGIPVIGGFAASRILMSPTPLQGQLTASTSPQVEQFSTVVRQDTLAARAPASVAGGSSLQLPGSTTAPNVPTATDTAGMLFGLPRKTVYMIAGALFVVVLLIVVTRRR